VKDPRFPHFLPYSILRRRRLKRTIDRGIRDSRVYLALTFDVEKPFVSESQVNSSNSVEDFLRSLSRDALEERTSTLFIQGNLVERNGKWLSRLEAGGHTLGIHGYDHELWGGPTWFLGSKPLTTDEKERRLRSSLECFEKGGLKRPVLFRAPNMLADDETLALLSRHGFVLDSSPPAFRGFPPLPTAVDSRLMRIPISSNPLFELKRSKGIAYCFYRLFDFRSIHNLCDEELFSLIGNVCSLQASFGVPSHLVFLGHSWEFHDWGLKGRFGYCSTNNWNLLKNRLSKIEGSTDVEYVTMTELYKALRRDAHV